MIDNYKTKKTYVKDTEEEEECINEEDFTSSVELTLRENRSQKLAYKEHNGVLSAQSQNNFLTIHPKSFESSK